MVHLTSSFTNHSTGNVITPTDTTCGHFITPTDTTCGPPLAKSRFCLVYTIYIVYIRADYNELMPPRVLASGPKPCGGNNLDEKALWVASRYTSALLVTLS